MASVFRRSIYQVVNKGNLSLHSSRPKTTEANILKSIHKDIKITNQTVRDFAWQNLDRWPDKTCTVSISVLYEC